MKYRLKDQELQRHLDAISDGDFSRQIEGNLQNIKGRGTTDADYRLFFGELPGRYEIVNRFSILLYEHEIEVFEEYDPNDWNNFPEVTPPDGVLMRVETVGGDTFRGYFHTFPDGVGRWCCVCFTPRHMPLHETEKVKRYRPWE
jgi:hypothetical protein